MHKEQEILFPRNRDTLLTHCSVPDDYFALDLLTQTFATMALLRNRSNYMNNDEPFYLLSPNKNVHNISMNSLRTLLKPCEQQGFTSYL